ncbi:MAG: DUF2500 family protein [Myxococcota bacterium]
MRDGRTRVRALLAQVEADERYAGALAHEPKVHTALYEIATVFAFAMSLLFVLAGLAMMLFVGTPTLVLWVLMSLLFAALTFHGMIAARRYARAPVHAAARYVQGKRTHTSGGTDSGPTTSYFVTLEDADGVRRELRSRGRIAGLLVSGDAGVAYIKRDWLVEFRRF